MRRSGFRLDRYKGQNFLVDPNTLDKIIHSAGLKPDDVVLEIGAGIGTLTVELAARVAAVVTVELDRRLDPILAETLAPFPNVTLLTMDAMDLSAADIPAAGRAPNKLVANLPYGIAAPVILRVCARLPEIQTLTVMVQREIAERMLARPGTRTYSGFTVKLAYFCRAERVMNVSRNVFMPPPNVDSVVIKLVRRDDPLKIGDREKLFEIITAGFSQRRKRLANAIGAKTIGYTKDQVEKALNRLGLPLNARAETLDLDEFGRLTTELEKIAL